ncbi:hypothetical protein AC1031_010027 [Aphanomyces cochlioides]|nr:hypothetical protein AC1031_010027 [Aphanomyces cochlioides]
MDAIENFLDEQDDLDAGFWFCMFNNNQHEPSDDMFLTKFRDSLTSIGRVVMVVHPWHSPESLKRLCTERTDRKKIESIIAPVGYPNLDKMIYKCMNEWMGRNIDQQIRIARRDNDPPKLATWLKIKGRFLTEQSQLEEAKACYAAAHDLYNDLKLQREEGRTIAASAYLRVLKDEHISTWESVLNECRVYQTTRFGPKHPDTLASKYYLAIGLFLMRNRAKEVKMLLRECSESLTNLENPRVLRIHFEYGLAMHRCGKNVLSTMENIFKRQKAMLVCHHPHLDDT